MRKTAFAMLATALTLAACDRGPEQKPLDDNVAEVENFSEEANIVEAAPPANTANTVVEKAAPAPGFSESEQMRDDADATGMTARLPDDDGGPGQTGNETRPAE